MLYRVRDVEDVVVLICGHGGRDMRCGITGPVLQDEFSKSLDKVGLHVESSAVEINFAEGEKRLIGDGEEKKRITARVGLISHIGGHKFAGNVIVYVPPGMRTADGAKHPLEGCGIWYGRVEPRHVEGIVRETVMGGKVIEELFRGGIRKGGEILRI